MTTRSNLFFFCGAYAYGYGAENTITITILVTLSNSIFLFLFLFFHFSSLFSVFNLSVGVQLVALRTIHFLAGTVCTCVQYIYLVLQPNFICFFFLFLTILLFLRGLKILILTIL